MTPTDLDASIIIPAYGRGEQLRRALVATLSQDYDPARYEVIVVDSSPDDRNMRLIAQMQAQARCPLRSFTRPPEGPGPSRNLGASLARGRILAFMDSDCMPVPSWLTEGLKAFNAEVGLVQGRTVPEPGSHPTPLSAFLRIEQETFIYEAANIFYRRDAFEQTSGFPADPHCNRGSLLGGEDSDLAWAVKGNGWRSRFAPEALILHPVVPISPVHWLFNKRLYVLPRLAGDWPQIRRHLFGRYFLDIHHAWLTLALVGMAAAAMSLWGLLLALPYVLHRLLEPTGTFRGPRRPLRVLAYLARDTISLGILLAGSLRHGALLL